MKISVYTLTSAISDPEMIARNSQKFLAEIATQMEGDFEMKGEDFSDFATAELPVVFVRTGGTEGKFKEMLPQVKGYVRLLTSGMNNSLAASMEILSYLRQQGREGEILHGSARYIARRLSMDYRVEQARKKLQGARLGVVGEPSDWLIASGVDRDVVKARLSIEFVDIAIDELVAAYHAVDMQGEEWQRLMQDEVVLAFDQHAPHCLRQYREGAFRLYVALQTLVRKYQLQGFTLRCFDLLSLVHNTGCMALAMFNARGIPASCEGDIPALLTMAIGQALTGTTGFQANPSRIDVEANEITFAHCTVPLNMVRSYSYNTHFESGIGIGLKGEFDPGAVTIAKVSGDLKRSWFCKAELVGNLSEANLCRTQIVLRGEGFADYFFTSPIGNHHLIFQGDHRELFETFMKG